MGGRGLAPERVRDVLGYLEAGMNPMQAARASGVSKSAVYRLDRKAGGVSRLALKREAAAARAALRAASPGRGMAPERVQALVGQLRAGLNPMQAARAAGVSKSYACRLHHKMGGVYRPPAQTCNDRYLDREERYEIARLRESGLGVRQTGEKTGRSPSAISRGLNRNADPRTSTYQPERARTLAGERQKRPKPSKLPQDPALRQEVQEMLNERYSPEQASGRLKVLHPGDPAMRVSHETIYQSIYLYPRGELRRELTACLRTGRSARRRRGRRQAPGAIIGAVPIGQRPPEVEGRLVPGHHEGDLIMGTKASNSAVGTIVERTTGYLTLLPLHAGHDAVSVADAILEHMSALPAWFTRTLTWDRGSELARHQRITAAGLHVYFADPHSPWQRGSNENTNGLLREYLPKGTDLSTTTPAQLAAIADHLNNRPRKRYGYHTPREQLAKLLQQEEQQEQQRVATTP